jgi:glycosyltransferase involved in cell wall biosynthesis
MRVLLINEYKRGFSGVDTVVDMHIKCLERNGIQHEIFRCSSEYYKTSNWIKKISVYIQSITGNLLISELRNIIEVFQPDIIHIHNIYPLLFKSIIKGVRNSNSKIVMHLHNYYPFCLNSYFYNKNAICTSCIENNNWKSGVSQKCYDNSFLKSIATVFGRIKPKLFRSSLKVNKYVAVSNFVKDVYIRYGLKSESIDVIYNPSSTIPIEPNKENDYVLYLGAILVSKGLLNLINAAKQLPEIKFKIVGDGKDKDMLMKYATGVNNIQFIESVFGIVRNRLFNNCRFVIVPSEWWETFCLVATEANSCGKYVLTSGQGGLSEVIDGKKSGNIYDTKNKEDLVINIRKLWKDLEKGQVLTDCVINAEKFSFERFCNDINTLYKGLLVQK